MVSVRAGIPGFGDELDFRQHRILGDGVEKARMLVEHAANSGESRREIEPETVDPHLFDPVAQAVHHHPQHIGVPESKGVAGTGEIVAVPLVAFHQVVVGFVVDTPETERRPHAAAFGRMVVDDVEDHFDIGIVHLLHEDLEGIQAFDAQIFRVRREKPDAVVSPVIAQPVLDQMPVLNKRVNGKKLDRRNAKIAQIVDHRRRGKSAERAARRFGHVRVAFREPGGMHLIDHGFMSRDVVPDAAPK